MTIENNLPGDFVFVPTGWQCPVCGAVNAPGLLQCLCRGNAYTSTTISETPQ